MTSPPAPMPRRPLLAAAGNPFRGDDGAGPALAALVAAALPASALLVTVTQQFTPELAAAVAEASRVVFADADLALPPGQFRLEPLTPAETPSLAAHSATPASILAWARDLYHRAPPAWLCRIGAASFDLEERLTPPVADACRRAATEVIACLSRAESA